MEAVAAARGVALACEAPGRAVVTGDAGWLERLLLILLDNAIKFTPAEGRVVLTVSRARAMVQLSVSDTGTGIPPDAMAHLFEPFYRADPARSRQTEGAGLGLALARWIVDRHRGTLDVRSRPGEGSTFTLHLPLAPAESRDQR
jgi:signal transduction histidine kinase